MKKLIFILVALLYSVVTMNAERASCSGSDGVSYVTVETKQAPSPGINFIVKGYGQYKDATAFISFKTSGSDKEYQVTVDIRNGEGNGYSSLANNHEIKDLKVTVASFCK